MVCRVLPATLDEIGVGRGHRGVVGQWPGRVVHADALVDRHRVAGGIEARHGLVLEVDKPDGVVLAALLPITADGEASFDDPVEVPRVLVFLHHLRIGVARLGVTVELEVALAHHEHRVFLHRRIGPAIGGLLIEFDGFFVIPFVEVEIGLVVGVPCHGFVGPAAHHRLPFGADFLGRRGFGHLVPPIWFLLFLVEQARIDAGRVIAVWTGRDSGSRRRVDGRGRSAGSGRVRSKRSSDGIDRFRRCAAACDTERRYEQSHQVLAGITAHADFRVRC